MPRNVAFIDSIDNLSIYLLISPLLCMVELEFEESDALLQTLATAKWSSIVLFRPSTSINANIDASIDAAIFAASIAIPEHRVHPLQAATTFFPLSISLSLSLSKDEGILLIDAPTSSINAKRLQNPMDVCVYWHCVQMPTTM
ncbi:hypothetical protein PsorP6_007980 [Peronosclerospora sorghi]|uniref:Uncharacterized protein n=1 Tax=Peronosclerospora sorghi TaxID=230839 RepID=A0ACC0WAK2_9STRA|nr:hypothetical protein PsorP6_007980 [Peronosclerospora sorghi]